MGALKHGHNRRGMKQSPTYVSWHNMMQRCYYQRHDKYSHYGGRGVKVHDRWHDFACFLEDMGERPKGKTLDRFPDREGDYGPGNCRWADRYQQGNNRRDNTRVEHDGRILTVAEWARVTGFSRACIHLRLFKYHWPPSEALTRPPKPDGKTLAKRR